MKSKQVIIMLMMVLIFVLPHVADAQPMPDNNDTDTPIDGGIGLLIAAGAAIGAKKVKSMRKNNSHTIKE